MTNNTNNNTGKDLLSKIKFNESYSKFIQKDKRLETWEESCDDVMSMHKNKFSKLNSWAEIEPYYKSALTSYKNMEVLASQRNLQFREKHILKHNCKLYNCATTYVDRDEVFKQIMWVLLCGSGVGFSVEKRFVEKLSTIKKRDLTSLSVHTIDDSIEGWAIAIDVLLSSYFNGTNKIVFDYSMIRGRGELIAGEFLAPGYEGLKKSIELIEDRLDAKLKMGESKLTPLNCHDIICILSDAVLSGGVRRSALISVFDKDDTEMISCKTGDWFTEAPWRARANNSAKVLKDSMTSEELDTFKEYIKQFGEPAFVLVSDMRMMVNPCQPSWATVLTPEGIKTMGEVGVGDYIWSETGFTKILKKWSTGVKPVYRYKTTAGEFVGTENHRLVSNGVKIEAKDCDSVDSLVRDARINLVVHPQDVMNGLMLGGGGLHRASKDLKVLYIGDNDGDYHTSEVAYLITKQRNRLNPKDWEVETTLSTDCFVEMYNREIPEEYMKADFNKVCSFLRGMYSANGSVVRNRITYKTTSQKLRNQLQILLSSIGIKSYYTTNKERETKFSNEDYICRESYDINITTSRKEFYENIGFIQKYKMDKIDTSVKGVSMDNSPIVYKEYISTEEVFDITVENDTHTYWTGGLNVSNCVEIGFIPVNPKTGNSCWSFCNLTEIIGSACKTKEDFFHACRSASTIGTFQASYTDFSFLGKDTEELVRWEALLGVSITGIMNNPQVLLDEDTLKEGAEIVKDTNKIVSKLIGINQSARTTCIKPSGNASVLAKTASGIHPAHAHRFFRTIQLNKDTPMAKYLSGNFPELLEEGVWSTSGTDYACFIPIIESDETIVKNQVSEVDFLKAVQTVYKNWVLSGANTDIGYSKDVTHNVSNTVSVKSWDKTFDYILENKNDFCGLSFLPDSGDKVYKQAPFVEVFTLPELVNKYGDAAIFASGLIVDALHSFNNDLWDACLAVRDRGYPLSGDRITTMVKRDIVTRIKKFSKNYFKGSLIKTIDCLKDVHLYHKWVKINRVLSNKEVDFSKIDYTEKYLKADELSGAACSGGSCEINF